MDADEYLSRMKRTDRFMPVVTVVVYYSEKPWDSKINYNVFERGDGNMCTLFDTIAKENKVEGRAEGRVEEIVETGYEFGLSENDILERLQKKLDVSLQKAQEYFNMFKKQAV